MKKISIILIVFLIGCTKNTTINNNITPATKPVLTTNPINNISNTMAFSGGTFITDGESNILSKGVCWSTNHNPTINDFKSDDGTGVTNYSSVLTGLSRNTTYYVKAFATNSVGIGYGNEVSFTTTDSSVIPIGNLPTVIINSINSIATNNAIAYGNVTNQGSSSVTAKGFKYFTTPNYSGGWQTVSVGTGLGTFSKTINSLQPNTTYYISAYATNSFGTAFSNEISFTTSNTPATVTDIDGNLYNTVTIGSQVWMVENLKVSKYRDGTSIPNVTDNTQWTNLTTGAYCYYENNSSFNNTYGKLYNWYAVNNSKNIAPTGWHVPSDAEWITLYNYLGGQTVCGGALKSTNLWSSPNTGATNSSGFTGVGAGIRFDNTGTFSGTLGQNGDFWSSSVIISSDKPRGYALSYNNTYLGQTNDYKARGKSVRCVKD
jgi:uncharacterized protein (TIGR02145 family)